MDVVLLGAANGGGQRLPVTQDLGLWLKSDAGVTLVSGAVDSWADQSGTARHFSAPAAANRPAYGTIVAGKPVLTFDGLDDYLLGNAASLNLSQNVPGFSVFIVARYATGVQQRSFGTSTNVAASARTLIGVSTTQWQVGARRLDADGAVVLSGGTVNNNLVVQCGLLRYSAATAAVFVNGVSQVDAAFQTAGNSQNTASARTIVGAGTDLGNLLNGQIGEIIVYQRTVTPLERERITRYLQTRWQIP